MYGHVYCCNDNVMSSKVMAYSSHGIALLTLHSPKKTLGSNKLQAKLHLSNSEHLNLSLNLYTHVYTYILYMYTFRALVI